jgi:hypothetical protein
MTKCQDPLQGIKSGEAGDDYEAELSLGDARILRKFNSRFYVF